MFGKLKKRIRQLESDSFYSRRDNNDNMLSLTNRIDKLERAADMQNEINADTDCRIQDVYVIISRIIRCLEQNIDKADNMQNQIDELRKVINNLPKPKKK